MTSWAVLILAIGAMAYFVREIVKRARRNRERERRELRRAAEKALDVA